MLSIKSLEVEPIAGVLQELSIRVNKGVCPFDIAEVCANADGTLFFIHGNRIRNPGCVCNGINEAGCAQLLYLGFHRSHFGWMDGLLLLVYGCHIRPCVDVVIHDGWM